MIHRDPTPWPTHLFLEGSVHCNCDCITCPSPVLHRPDLDPELAFSIIDQCAGKPIKEVHPFLYADPFVWPYLFDLMEYIQVVLPKTEIHLWTNGILLDEATAKTAIEVGLTNLAVSIDGASKETYSTIRRGSDYDLVVAHTLRFLEIAPKNIFVRVHMTVTESNRHEVNKFLDFWRPRLAGRGEASTHLNDGRGERVGRLPAVHNGARPEYPCVQPFYGLFVLSDGQVVQCCMDYDHSTVVGDLNYQTVEEVWNGPELARVRELHNAGRKQEMMPCAVCKSYM